MTGFVNELIQQADIPHLKIHLNNNFEQRVQTVE
jgi:hypothetical protein